MNKFQEKLLYQLLSLPTAPFRESYIKTFATDLLARKHVPWFEDDVGNIIVGCDSPSRYRQLLNRNSKDPVRVFIAHMDHPGFHGVRWLSDTRLKIKWFGGSPVKYLRGADMWLATATQQGATGKLGKVHLADHGHSIDSAEVVVKRDSWSDIKRPAAKSVFGGFGFRKPVWTQGKKIYTRAADDLSGVFSILCTAISLYGGKDKKEKPFIGLLTRAEEVGFVGAIAHLEMGMLRKAKRPVVAISLEASRTLPGAQVGQGPVIRLGDHSTVFSHDYLQVLIQLARKTLPGKHQKRIMDGGACEATVTSAYGLPTVGISVPLGNYHNIGFEGGPDCRGKLGPAPEYIHLDDLHGELLLCRKLMGKNLGWDKPWVTIKKRLDLRLRTYKRYL